MVMHAHGRAVIMPHMLRSVVMAMAVLVIAVSTLAMMAFAAPVVVGTYSDRGGADTGGLSRIPRPG